ncbi:MAG: molybdopterin-dependent oxidoreductase [Armatimonadetes bacterium]|nr:molybdopterin-dependent oxidoreductase [Armatimonadota bacterium]
MEEEKNFFEKLKDYKIKRRSFLKYAGLTGGAAVFSALPIGGKKLKEVSSAYAQSLIGERNFIYSCCNMCGGQSGIKVLVENGIVKKIEPNEHNPIGVCNIFSDYEKEKARGARLCPKGNSAVKSLYDPDRLKTPMRRVGERGSGKWEPITWEEAVEEAAKRLKEIKEKYGPEALVWFSEDHSFTNIQADFCSLFGTPNYHNHSNLCDVARKRNFSLVMGDERPLPDFANSKYMLIFGWNMLSATKWSHLPAIINRGRERGSKMVVVDPVFNHTAAKADEWIPIRPGTDGALALALGNIIVKEKLYDQEFINYWTAGFPEYAKFVEDKTPEWAEKITSVPAETTRRIARELAARKPVCIDAWSGPGHHTNSTQGGRAIAMLCALLGQYDKPGTQIIPERKGGKRRSLKFDKPKLPRVDGLGSKYPFGHGSGIYVEAREAMLTGKPYQPKAAVFIFQNWVMSVPNTKKNFEAIKNMEFILAVDTHLSETAELADIVVPGAHFLERYDLTGNWVNFSALSLRQPVVQSWIGGWPEYKFVMELGKKLNLKDKDGKGFEMSYEDYLSDELKGGIGITLDELKKLPGAVWVKGPTRYEKYKDIVKFPEGGSVDSKTMVVKDKDGKGVGIKWKDLVFKGFNTPSRLVEFYSKQLEKAGYNPLPEYTPPEDAPTNDYPLFYVSWKQTEHTHTRTFNNAWLMEMKGDNPLWINTETAKKYALKDGDEIWIESPYAKAKATVFLTEGIHPEVVGQQHGFGHWALGRIAKGKGTNDGQFMPGKIDKISGQAVTKEVGVKIYKA